MIYSGENFKKCSVLVPISFVGDSGSLMFGKRGGIGEA